MRVKTAQQGAELHLFVLYTKAGLTLRFKDVTILEDGDSRVVFSYREVVLGEVAPLIHYVTFVKEDLTGIDTCPKDGGVADGIQGRSSEEAVGGGKE